MQTEDDPEVKNTAMDTDEDEDKKEKVKILEKDGKVVRIEIYGEKHTLLSPLTSKLLDNEMVDIATYNIAYTQISNPILYVKMKEGDPLAAVKSALAVLAAEYEEFEQKYKACAGIVNSQ